MKLIYKDIAPNAREHSVPSATNKQPFSVPDKLKFFEEPKSYATIGELNQLVLDGTQEFMDKLDVALWSVEQSKTDGSFSNELSVEFKLNALYSTPGITVEFLEEYGDVQIIFYRGQTVLDTKDFKPDSLRYFCEVRVESYDRLKIVFKSLRNPYKYVKLANVYFGTIREYGSGDLKSLSVNQTVAITSDKLTINTMNFVMVGSDDDLIFQKTQPVELEVGDELICRHYITKYTKQSATTYSVQTQDIVGMLAKQQFMGGIYVNKNVGDLLAEIIGDYPYDIKDEFKAKTITGYLKITNKRDALMRVAFALNLLVDTSGGDIRLYKTDKTAVEPITQIYEGTTHERSSKIAQVNLKVHSYAPINETSELFKGTGVSSLVTFDKPHHDLSLSNGTIHMSGANYAVITTTNGILTGKQYSDSVAISSVSNPNISVTEERRTVGYETTLYVESIIQDLYEKNINNGVGKLKHPLKGHKLGEVVSYNLFGKEQKGILTSQKFKVYTDKLFSTSEVQDVNF